MVLQHLGKVPTERLCEFDSRSFLHFEIVIDAMQNFLDTVCVRLNRNRRLTIFSMRNISVWVLALKSL